MHSETFAGKILHHAPKKIHKCLYTPKLFTGFFTCKNFYAQTFSHGFLHTNLLYAKKMRTGGFTPRCVDTHTHKNTHTESSTQKMFLRRKTFQHTICCRNFHTHFLQTGDVTRINFDTQALLHKGAFTHRKFKRRIFYTP